MRRAEGSNAAWRPPPFNLATSAQNRATYPASCVTRLHFVSASTCPAKIGRRLLSVLHLRLRSVSAYAPSPLPARTTSPPTLPPSLSPPLLRDMSLLCLH